MAETAIEWTATPHPDGRVFPGYTFNPWTGCQELSPACDGCYARKLAKRSPSTFGGWGPHAERKRTSDAYWRQPLGWNRRAERLGIRLKVFCASMADVFDNQVPPEWRRDLWDLIYRTPNLDWLLLTKRPANIARMLPLRPWGAGWPNVWLGVTVENREEMARRGPALRAVPAARRFWSAEPLLEDLGAIPSEIMPDWIIAGGETGRAARPSSPEWFRSLRDQSAEAGAAFFFKQWGVWVPTTEVGFHGHERKPRIDLPPHAMIRLGKLRAGALLDGRLHREWPTRAAATIAT